MAIGPVQLIVLGFNHPEFHGEIITELVRLRDHLDNCIGCGCLSLENCPLRNPWDVLAEEGPGPRLLDPEG